MLRARSGPTGYTVRSLFVAIFLWNAAHAQQWLTESQDKDWPAELAVQPISEWAPSFPEELLGTQEWSRLSRVELDEFSKQVARLVSNETLSEGRRRAVPQVLRDMKKVFDEHWPGSRVAVFGSLTYGLAMRTSDVDCTLLLSRRAAAPALALAATALGLSPAFTDLTPIPWTRIPVLTLKHKPTQFKVDLTINNLAGIQISNMFKYLLHLNDRIYKLAFVVKQWASTRQITTVESPGLSNYGMTLMVIFYLQQRNMMPSIASLQSNAEPFYDDEWNMGFCETEYKMQNYVPLDLLLGEFFKYYADFDYDRYIVSPYAGYPVEKRFFTDLKQVPHEFGLYVHNVGAEISKPLSLGNAFVLQDAFIHNQNVAEFADARPSSTFIEQFQIAARKFRENKMDFLENLLIVDPNI